MIGWMCQPSAARQRCYESELISEKAGKNVGRKEVSLEMGPLWWFPKTKCDNICLSLMGLTLPLNTSADFYCLLVSGILPAVVGISTTILIK